MPRVGALPGAAMCLAACHLGLGRHQTPRAPPRRAAAATAGPQAAPAALPGAAPSGGSSGRTAAPAASFRCPRTRSHSAAPPPVLALPHAPPRAGFNGHRGHHSSRNAPPSPALAAPRSLSASAPWRAPRPLPPPLRRRALSRRAESVGFVWPLPRPAPPFQSARHSRGPAAPPNVPRKSRPTGPLSIRGSAASSRHPQDWGGGGGRRKGQRITPSTRSDKDSLTEAFTG